jgi:hypothetical protein
MTAIEYQEFTTDALPASSAIIIGTDGVREMLNEQQELTQRAMARRANITPSAAEIAGALEADLATFRGAQIPPTT